MQPATRSRGLEHDNLGAVADMPLLDVQFRVAHGTRRILEQQLLLRLFVRSGPTIAHLFCGLGVSVEGRYEAVETKARE